MSQNAQLVAVLGAGGVGKTTTSAAIALGLASQGRRAAVITVDPAHRLASVLGLKGLSNEPQQIANFENGGSLSALWLDTSQALAELVRRHAKQAPSIERVLQHRLFKIIQNQLGGVEEYLGVEKVLALRESGDFDVLILDTPPSQHALDFLESPRHLLRFFDESVLKVFLDEPHENEKKHGIFGRVFRSGRDQMLEVFKNFLGSGFLGELSDLLRSLKPVHSLFTETANAIESWVREPSTRFAVVSLYEPYPLDEAHLLSRELVEHGLAKPQLMIMNKCLPTQEPPVGELIQSLGPEGTEALIRSYELQKDLREKLVAGASSSGGIAEVRRYSVKQLSREQLLDIGTGILRTWLDKDPKAFSRS
jgi:anion-transporting  ArsA/GET3 family ATPase